MAVALNALFDRQRLARTRARLRAWWDGEAFDEEAFKAEQANESALGGADDALFDPPPFDMPPRLAALNVIWGDGRVRPGDDAADGLEPARIGAAPEGRIAVLGPGMVGPLAAFAAKHAGPIDVFEWRDESVEALRYGVAKARLDGRVTVTRVDLEAHVWTPGAFDGLWSVDDFAYCSFPPHLAQQMMKCLKPGACAVVETYLGLPCAELSTAFASSFAEPQIRAHGDVLQILKDVGFTVEADEDLTEEFLDMARQSLLRLGAVLADPSKLDVASARELAWEVEAWRVRLKLLGQRRLERRRFILRKASSQDAAEPQAENANAPAG